MIRLPKEHWKKRKMTALEKWFAKKIPSFYVNIADEYKSCPEMEKWETNYINSTEIAL